MDFAASETDRRIAMRRLWALVLKEFRQILRNRPLLVSLLVPPTVQIIIFGIALNPTVNHLRLGLVDEARTASSRSLVSAFVVNHTFDLTRLYASASEVAKGLSTGQVDAALIVPADFDRQRLQLGNPQVQLLVDATNANTATIAQGYASTIVARWNQTHPGPPAHEAFLEAPDTDRANHGRTSSVPSLPMHAPRVETSIALLYNPGLVTAWFVVTGTFGLLLILNSSLVAASTTVREKEKGTLEQLLMTPVGTTEIIIAKTAPLFILLMGDVGLILVVSRIVFNTPLRGSLALIVLGGALCVLVGIGIGTFIATFSRTALQAFLLTFFINPPLALLSGAVAPVEAMPRWLQPFTLLNPIRHFSIIARSVMIKGSGMDTLYPNFLALGIFATVLVTVSVRRYRDQLS